MIARSQIICLRVRDLPVALLRPGAEVALEMVTRGLAIDLEAQGVTVISLTPGWRLTELGGAGAHDVMTSATTKSIDCEALGLSRRALTPDLALNWR